MRSKQTIIDEQQREIQALRRYVADLRWRHDRAVGELADLAQGIGVTPPWSWTTHQDKIQYKAAQALATIAKHPLREAP